MNGLADAGVDRPSVSVVIPVHDEDETLRELGRRLAAVLDNLDADAEVILVDDGSHDLSYPTMVELARRDPRFKCIRLSRNWGHQVAITAGIDLAQGDAIVVMDGDLQHPPELIPTFVQHWREGYEVVYGVMTDRAGETWLKKTTAKLFYRLLRKLANVELPAAGDFRLVDRKVAVAFRTMRESHRYVRGMFAWIGFRQIGVPYRCPRRYAGRSKYSFGRMLGLAADGIVSFSDAPLRLVLKFGLVGAALSLLYGIVAIAVKVGGVFAVPGWASILVVVTFVGSIQLIVLGMIGEYVGRIYEQGKRRPLYFVSEQYGFDRSRLLLTEELRSSAG